MASPPNDQRYYLLPDLRRIDPSTREAELDWHAWSQPTAIEDEDLTFGGKTLCAWHEEERSRLSRGSAINSHGEAMSSPSPSLPASPPPSPSGSDEECRGRRRVRQPYGAAFPHPHSHSDNLSNHDAERR